MWRRLADVIFWIALAVYFGGLMTVGAIVAPAVFDTAESVHMSMPGIAAPPLDMPRQVGGEIFGAVLNRFAYVEAAALGMMLIGLAMWILGQKQVRAATWILLLLWALVAGMTAYDSAMLRPRVWDMRTTLRNTAAAHAADKADGSAATWPERAEFDRLHALSERLGSVKAYVLLAMLLIMAWRTVSARGENRGGEGRQFRDPLVRTIGKHP